VLERLAQGRLTGAGAVGRRTDGGWRLV
jgi:hypothetical protein